MEARSTAELAAHLVGRLAELGETLSVAESCTGGGLGAAITDVPGASAAFVGGVIAYANPVKSGVLGVPEPLIEEHGAVSEGVAQSLAAGVRQLLGTTWGLAVTGVAGPGGGSPAKPVGTVWLALAGPRPATRLLSGADTRSTVRHKAVLSALMLLEGALREGDLLEGAPQE
ncbi:MAG: nicotinamide-nucleotide amidohydrolase family protein [Gemmatimonadota bacterium]